MKSLSIFFAFILSIFVFSGCGQREHELPFSGPKIVLNAHLMAHKTPRIFVGKAWSINENFPHQSHYDDANVELWEGQTQVGTLRFTGQFYELPNYKILPRKTYRITVQIPGIGKAESRPVVVPPDPEVNDFEIMPLTEIVRKKEYVIERPLAISFTLINNALNRDDYFVVDIFGTSRRENDKLVQGDALVLHDETSYLVPLSEKACYDNFTLNAEASGYQGKKIDSVNHLPTVLSIGYKNSCFVENRKRIKMYVSKDIYPDEYPPLSPTIEAKKLNILVANYPAEYLKWFSSTRLPRENDRFPADAQPTYTNIIGGIGFVYATNLSVVKVFDLDSLDK